MDNLDGEILIVRDDGENVYLVDQQGAPVEPKVMLWLAGEIAKTAVRHQEWLEVQREKILEEYKNIGMVRI